MLAIKNIEIGRNLNFKNSSEIVKRLHGHTVVGCLATMIHSTRWYITYEAPAASCGAVISYKSLLDLPVSRLVDTL